METIPGPPPQLAWVTYGLLGVAWPQPKEGEILKLTSAWAQFKVDMEPVPEKIAKSLAEMRAVGKGPGIDVATDFLEQISGAAGNLLTNLNLAMLDRMEVPAESFGDSTGKLEGL